MGYPDKALAPAESACRLLVEKERIHVSIGR